MVSSFRALNDVITMKRLPFTRSPRMNLFVLSHDHWLPSPGSCVSINQNQKISRVNAQHLLGGERGSQPRNRRGGGSIHSTPTKVFVVEVPSGRIINDSLFFQISIEHINVGWLDGFPILQEAVVRAVDPVSPSPLHESILVDRRAEVQKWGFSGGMRRWDVYVANVWNGRDSSSLADSLGVQKVSVGIIRPKLPHHAPQHCRKTLERMET